MHKSADRSAASDKFLSEMASDETTSSGQQDRFAGVIQPLPPAKATANGLPDLSGRTAQQDAFIWLGRLEIAVLVHNVDGRRHISMVELGIAFFFVPCSHLQI